MFTGIIEETGTVSNIRTARESIQLSVRLRKCGRGLREGDSLAVNGCCLTVATLLAPGRTRVARFDLLKETWNRTNLRFVRPGSLVNLERPLAANGRLDGHFVTGHVDGTGTIARLEKRGNDRLVDIEAPAEVRQYVIPKGSIAVDGISLTIAQIRRATFRVWIIPHTWEVTALRQRKKGDAVNLEADLLGKYVKRFISSAWKS